MAKFFIRKKKEKSESTSGFWVPLAIVIAGALIAGAVVAKDQLRWGKRQELEAVKTPEPTAGKPTEAPAAKGEVAGERVDLFIGASPMLGEASASVTLTEFTDFQCPACQAFFSQTFPLIKAEYLDKSLINFVLKHFPLSFHKNAEKAAEAAECARAGERFWEYHDLLYGKQAEWSVEADPSSLLVGYAGGLGLNTANFKACLGAGAEKLKINDDLDLGKKVGISGTPTVFVNGRRAGRPGYIPSFPEIQQLIEEELKK